MIRRRSVLVWLGAIGTPTQVWAATRAIHSGGVALPEMGPSYREVINYDGPEPVGTIIIMPGESRLLRVLPNRTAENFRISVGREGFGWSGVVQVAQKREWPEWHPPAEMRQRTPGLPEMVPAGPYNPLGARALYLYRNGVDTLYRIHGTNDPKGVGFDNTSGCFRMTNTDVMYLYEQVRIGTKVIVKAQ